MRKCHFYGWHGQWRVTRYCTKISSVMMHIAHIKLSTRISCVGGFFKAGSLSDCWCMWEANKWWRLVEVGEITEEYPVMLPLSNPRPLHVHQPVFFMSSKTMHIFMLRSSTHYFPKVSLLISNLKSWIETPPALGCPGAGLHIIMHRRKSWYTLFVFPYWPLMGFSSLAPASWKCLWASVVPTLVRGKHHL